MQFSNQFRTFFGLFRQVWLKNNAFFLFGLSVGWNKNERFFAKIFGGNKKRLYLCTRKQRERVLKKKMVRQFSRLEYMPVTHGVASSSLVRTAKSSRKRGLFLYLIETVLYCACFFRYTTNSIMGLTGFDSKDNGFVSMQAHASEAFKNGCKTIIGENNYALAA